jgi:hypothetical protein
VFVETQFVQRKMGLNELIQQREAVFKDRDSRVRAFTFAGVQVCLAGLGEKGTENEFTFPACYNVQSALDSPHWIRKATAEELQESSDWWRRITFQPMCIIHGNGTPAVAEDPIGLHGCHVTVLAQVPQVTYESKECADLGDVHTPTTPPLSP